MKSKIILPIDKMNLKELNELLKSNHPSVEPFKNYIKLKIEEKSIIRKYLNAA